VHSHSEPPSRPTQENWVELLAVCVKFEVTAGIYDAKEALLSGNPDPLSPTLQLHLGRLYHFDDWVSSAAVKVACIPLLELSLQDHSLLGRDSIYLLNQLHVKLLRHRQSVATALPTQLAKHSALCLDPKSCSAAWLSACHRISRLVLRAVDPISDLVLLSVVESKAGEAMGMKDMSVSCAQIVTERCAQALTGKDERLFERVVGNLALLL
jgi:hypothetical protein